MERDWRGEAIALARPRPTCSRSWPPTHRTQQKTHSVGARRASRPRYPSNLRDHRLELIELERLHRIRALFFDRLKHLQRGLPWATRQTMQSLTQSRTKAKQKRCGLAQFRSRPGGRWGLALLTGHRSKSRWLVQAVDLRLCDELAGRIKQRARAFLRASLERHQRANQARQLRAAGQNKREWAKRDKAKWDSCALRGRISGSGLSGTGAKRDRAKRDRA